MILSVGSNDFILATYDFILKIFRLAVSFLKSIPIGITVLGQEVSLFHFLIAVLLMGIVVTAIVNVVKTTPIGAVRDANDYVRRYRRARAEKKGKSD